VHYGHVVTEVRESEEQGVVRVVSDELKSPRAAGVAGLVFAGLFIASFLLLRHTPPEGSTAAQIATFYLRTNIKRLAIVELYVGPFAGIAFLWFVAVIRARIGAREDRFFATVFLGSGILFAGMFFGALAAGGAVIAAIKFQGAPPPSPDTFVLARGLAYTFLYIFAMRAAAVFTAVVSTIALRTGALPRWLAFVGYALALVLLLGVAYTRWTVLFFPLWVAAVSVVILVRHGEPTGAARADP
jgi:hypothetical protein